MTDPFHIDGPAVVSFSGGRTSAYMLRRILDAGLRPDVHVLFADTGKERPETYAFVRACASAWDVEIHWVARPSPDGVLPFNQLIRDRRFLPNPVARFCTQELKIRPMKLWMQARGYEHWTNVVGLRSDEPRRVARMRAGKIRDVWDVVLPLADAGITEADVLAYWRESPFNLGLSSWEGNCDLCFLKGANKIRRVMEDRPDLADWWIAAEEEIGATFRSDRPPYAALLSEVSRQSCLDFLAADEDGEIADCICID